MTERIDILVEACRLGMSITDAADAAHIKPDVLRRWLKRHPEIRPQLEAVKNEGKLRALSRIAKAGEEARHWTANAWLLERTYPSEYGQRQRIDLQSVTVSLDAYLAEMGHDPAILTPEQRRAIVSTVIGELASPDRT
jgi:hypothetical protein